MNNLRKQITNSKKTVWLILIFIIIFIFLTYLFLVIPQNVSIKQQLALENKTKHIRSAMLNSQDPRIVVTGIMIDYFPEDELILDKGAGNGTFSFRFYGIELTETQYSKIVDYFLQDNHISGGEFDLSNIINKNKNFSSELRVTNWYKYKHNWDHLVIKDGFMCLYPLHEEHIDGLWKPIDYNSQFVAPPPLLFRCSYLNNISENSPSKVAEFIKNFFETNQLGTIDELRIHNDEELEEYFQNENFNVPGHTASARYKGKYDKLTDEFKSDLLKELKDLSEIFKSVNWDTEIKDTTSTKPIRKWYSLQLAATNNSYNCKVYIDLIGNKYNDSHPKEREMREKYPNISDEEYEKIFKGGTIEKKIYCYKALSL